MKIRASALVNGSVIQITKPTPETAVTTAYPGFAVTPRLDRPPTIIAKEVTKYAITPSIVAKTIDQTESNKLMHPVAIQNFSEIERIERLGVVDSVIGDWDSRRNALQRQSSAARSTWRGFADAQA